MKLVCSQCQQAVQIDDAKVPAGTFKVKCPKCSNVITAQKAAPSSSAAENITAAVVESPVSDASSSEGDVPLATQAFVKKEIAAMKNEILAAMASLFGGDTKWREAGASPEADMDDPLSKKALICSGEDSQIDFISSVLRRLGYALDVARGATEAIKKMDAGSFNLVITCSSLPDDAEAGTKIIGKLNGQKPAMRRQTFIIVVSPTLKNGDSNAAFFQGANLTVNANELKNLETLIREGQRHFQQIYSVFSRVLAEKERSE
ncbi:MAG: hypothetical protein C5B54_01585 [Acidobacteria bacterium]|nr:MAG: hypothetical protein C5B54_01585 [Acidobacteriota bacterium]